MQNRILIGRQEKISCHAMVENLLVFEPDVDFAHFTAPTIITDY
jgi:hypothetical protein